MSRFSAPSSILKPIRSGIRVVRDYFHYRPLPGYEPREVVRGRFSSRVLAEVLEADGICILENFLEPERLAACREAFESTIAESERDALRRADETPAARNHNVDCGLGGIFADMVLDELILAGVEEYYRRPIYLAMSRIQRLHPVEPYEDRAFQWHHDAKGKYVKAMWLLTDVPADGQRMSYVVGSHKVRHAFSTYEETRITEGQARRFGPILECAGPAGSVVVFDTNAVHRGNRNLGPIRETLVGVYSAGRYVQGCSFDASRLGHLSPWQRSVLERSRTPAGA